VSETDGKTVEDQAADGASVPPGASSAPKGEGQAAGAAESAGPSSELEKALADATKYKDQLLRTAADFDNFRKRTRRDLEDAQRKGLERALIELLPVSDNLERAVQAAQGTSDVGAIVDGVRMVLRFFEDALSRLGVERVPSVGGGFDPALHEAVQHVPSDAAPGTVVSEMVPGYRLGGKLLRAAVVAVAAPRPQASEPSGSDGGDSGGQGVPGPLQN
jgi:molecular chaperone GrpE